MILQETAAIIKNLRRGYLFSLQRATLKDLNRRWITDAVKVQFLEAGIPLSGKAKIVVALKGHQWLIVDGECQYRAYKEQNEVVFCDPDKIMSREDFANKLGVSIGVIRRLENGQGLKKGLGDLIVERLWLNDKQADIIMLAAARDEAAAIKERFDRAMVELNREYGDYPQVAIFLKGE